LERASRKKWEKGIRFEFVILNLFGILNLGFGISGLMAGCLLSVVSCQLSAVS